MDTNLENVCQNPLVFDILPDEYAVCRLPAGTETPAWVLSAPGFRSVTCTPDEVSVVCRADLVPYGTMAVTGYRAMKIEGQLDFSLIGILARAAGALAEAGISIFVLSTYDTDYLFVTDDCLTRAASALRQADFIVRNAGEDDC